MIPPTLNSLDNVVKSLDHGFGSHQQLLKSVISFAIQQGHGQLCLILHLAQGKEGQLGPSLAERVTVRVYFFGREALRLWHRHGSSLRGHIRRVQEQGDLLVPGCTWRL